MHKAFPLPGESSHWQYKFPLPVEGWDWSYMANEENHALVADGKSMRKSPSYSCPPTIFQASCWELNVRSIPTSSAVFPLPVMCSHCQKKFPLLEESSHCQKKFPLSLVRSFDLQKNKFSSTAEEENDEEKLKYSYKLGVDQLEGRLAEYRERKVKYIEKIRTLEIYRESNLERIKILTNEVETLKKEKDVVDGKLVRLRKSSKDLEDIIESQRSDKVKEGVGYNAVPPPAADLYRSPKKDQSWTGLPEFADDTVLTIAGDRPAQRASTNKAEFVKAAERPTTDKVETAKKPAVKYAEMYIRTSKRRRVQRETTRSQNHAYKSPSHRSYGAPMRPSHGPAGHKPHGPPMRPMRSNMNGVKRTLAVRPQYRAPWVPTVNRNFPLLIENFPLVTQMFPLFGVAAQDMLILLDQRQ
nr:hypothetical protein [Tanacetum cinerariifolium]